MATSYTKTNWQDAPSTATPITAAQLNRMEKGIEDCIGQGNANELAIAANAEAIQTLESGIQLGSISITQLLLMAHPIGSIYSSTVATSPADLFGGTWERIKGRFLLAAGENEANTSTDFGSMSAGELNRPAGELGGEPKHILTEPEIAKHRHEKIYYADSGQTFGLAQTGTGTNSNWYLDYSGASDNPGDALNTGYSGGGQPHNNMPPYLAVYVWKRTA